MSVLYASIQDQSNFRTITLIRPYLCHSQYADDSDEEPLVFMPDHVKACESRICSVAISLCGTIIINQLPVQCTVDCQCTRVHYKTQCMHSTIECTTKCFVIIIHYNYYTGNDFFVITLFFLSLSFLL